MRIAVIAGLIHSFLPAARRQMTINDNEPFSHPAIDELGEKLANARLLAAQQPAPTPYSVDHIYVGHRRFKLASA